MNERIRELWDKAAESTAAYPSGQNNSWETQVNFLDKFAELIVADMHKKVIASILITDVVMEEKGQVPTSEDYIRAINKDFGVEE